MTMTSEDFLAAVRLQADRQLTQVLERSGLPATHSAADSPTIHAAQQIDRVARGLDTPSRSDVDVAFTAILAALFPPPAFELPWHVPLAFWATDIGQHCNQARARVYVLDDLVTVREAPPQVGISYGQIMERFLYAGLLRPVQTGSSTGGQRRFMLTPDDLERIRKG